MYRRNACYRLIPHGQLHALNYPCGKYGTARTLCSMLKNVVTPVARPSWTAVYTHTNTVSQQITLLGRRDATEATLASHKGGTLLLE